MSAAGAAGTTVVNPPVSWLLRVCAVGGIGCTGKAGGTTATGAAGDAEMLPVMVGSMGSVVDGHWPVVDQFLLCSGRRHAVVGRGCDTRCLEPIGPFGERRNRRAAGRGAKPLDPYFDESSALARLSKGFSACELLVSRLSPRAFSTACAPETAAGGDWMW